MSGTPQRTNEAPVFSIVVPVYNVEDYLERCMESVLSQDFGDYEVILVDDGSTDSSGEICDTYSERQQHVSVVHKANGGLCSARNAGLERARGEYIVAIDSDDWIAPGALRTLWEKAIEPHRPDAIIFNASKVFAGGDETVPCYAEEGYYDRERLELEILPYMIYDDRRPFCQGVFNPMACNKVYRRSILLEHHCSDERIRMGEDNAYVFECLYYSDSLVVLHDELYCYFQGNSASITSSYDAARFRNNRLLIDYLVARLAGKEEWLDRQLNAFKAYWLFMAVFHEARHGDGFASGRRHLKEEIPATAACDDVDASQLPFIARAYFALLKSGFYGFALGAAYVGSKLRKQR